MLVMLVTGHNNETSAINILAWLMNKITSPWHMPCVSPFLGPAFPLGDGYLESCPMILLPFKTLFSMLDMLN